MKTAKWEPAANALFFGPGAPCAARPVDSALPALHWGCTLFFFAGPAKICKGNGIDGHTGKAQGPRLHCAAAQRGACHLGGGASLLLYLKGKAPGFHDIDLLVAEADLPRARAELAALGALQPRPNPGSRPGIFSSLWCRADVDVMAGLVVVSGGSDHAFPLEPGDVQDWAEVDGVTVPLHSLAQWRTLYQLMGRPEKVRMIDGAPAR